MKFVQTESVYSKRKLQSEMYLKKPERQERSSLQEAVAPPGGSRRLQTPSTTQTPKAPSPRAAEGHTKGGRGKQRKKGNRSPTVVSSNRNINQVPLGKADAQTNYMEFVGYLDVLHFFFVFARNGLWCACRNSRPPSGATADYSKPHE